MKNGHVIIIDRYTRAMIMANQHALFVFGDNLERIGYGGQAAEARNCPNAIGIPTKISPSEYIFDDLVEADMPKYKMAIVRPFVMLRNHLRKGGTIVWPKDGVGTGLARLDVTAPTLFEAIEALKEKVFAEALSVTKQTLENVEKGKVEK